MRFFQFFAFVILDLLSEVLISWKIFVPLLRKTVASLFPNLNHRQECKKHVFAEEEKFSLKSDLDVFFS